MEPANKFNNVHIYPPNPQTERGFNSHIDCNAAKNLIVYCLANVVILRNADDLTKIDVYNEHKFDTTCARFSPDGKYVCSADIKGNVIIWETDGLHPIRRQYESVISGAIKDISWTGDNQRILVCGEGKNNYAKIFILDTGSSAGEILNNSKQLNGGDIRPIRPYRLAVGGEETIVCFYEGPPFKYKFSNKTHTGFVNSIRYSPKGNYFISVSHDKKINLYDGNTGELLKTLNHEGFNHEGAINFCGWFEDGKNFVTASNDKTIKVWDPETGLCVKTLKSKLEPQIEDFQVGLGIIKDKIFSVSLSGAINFWKYSVDMKDGELPLDTFNGHQGNIAQVVYNLQNKVLISGDTNGRIIFWKDGKASILKGKPHGKSVFRIVESCNQKTIYSVSVDCILKSSDIESQTITKEVELRKRQITDLVVSKSNPNLCYVAYEDNVVEIYDNLELIKEMNYKFSPSALEVSYNERILALGDTDGFVHLINLASGEEEGKLSHFNAKITCITFSSDDKLLAVGETGYKLRLWDVEKRESLTEKWVYHTSSITSVKFSKSNKHVLSTSLDNGIIIWNCETFDKDVEIKNLHKRGVTTAAFDNEDNIISGGNDKLIKVTKIGLGINL